MNSPIISTNPKIMSDEIQRLKDGARELTDNKVSWVSNGKLGAKNLLAYPYLDTTKTQNGVTFTDNGDGTITVSGKATGGSSSFRLHTRSQGESNDFVLKNGTYIFTGCPSGGSNNTYKVNIVSTKNGSAYSYGMDTGNGVTFTLNGDDYSADEVNLQITIDIANGTDIQTPLTFKPMIRVAEDNDNTYQPYAKTNKELTDDVRSLLCTQTTAGTYKLQATVAADGSISYEWVEVV